jgi:hypothetical protein
LSNATIQLLVAAIITSLTSRGSARSIALFGSITSHRLSAMIRMSKDTLQPGPTPR